LTLSDDRTTARDLSYARTDMADRWINAVIEVTVPLNVPVTATEDEKRDAVVDRLERLDLPPDAVATGRWELVEDGEPVE
jgi:hypothetical protein